MNFIALRAMTLRGVNLRAGEPVNVGGLTPGQVKRLIDFKRIVALGEDGQPVPPVPAAFDAPSTAQKIARAKG